VIKPTEGRAMVTENYEGVKGQSAAAYHKRWLFKEG